MSESSDGNIAAWKASKPEQYKKAIDLAVLVFDVMRLKYPEITDDSADICSLASFMVGEALVMGKYHPDLMDALFGEKRAEFEAKVKAIGPVFPKTPPDIQ
jgi:hypothetical protein